MLNLRESEQEFDLDKHTAGFISEWMKQRLVANESEIVLYMQHMVSSLYSGEHMPQ